MKNSSTDAWKYRRAVVFSSILFGMLSIGYILYSGSDSEVMQTAINAAFFFLGSVVLTYCGAATVDDYWQKRRDSDGD